MDYRFHDKKYVKEKPKSTSIQEVCKTSFDPKTSILILLKLDVWRERCMFLLNLWLVFRANSLESGRKLNGHKTFKRRPGCLPNVSYALFLRPVSRGNTRDTKTTLFDIDICHSCVPSTTDTFTTICSTLILDLNTYLDITIYPDETYD